MMIEYRYSPSKVGNKGQSVPSIMCEGGASKKSSAILGHSSMRVFSFKYLSGEHSKHLELSLLVQVSSAIHPSIGVQGMQVSLSPSCKYRPLSQIEHWESLAVSQITKDTQPGMDVHSTHRSLS
eukprot:Lithocolla_globosa_v1_NODE_37_length_8440_cov_24.995110.p2 type:complete len:124 gc:universal NODE_37_length_8440_cov_24.995110:6438-6809(+)